MNDVKHYPEQHRAMQRRALWAGIGAFVALLGAYGFVGAQDYADELRVAEAQRQQQRARVDAWRIGFADGQASVSCYAGFRVDSRTGERIK